MHWLLRSFWVSDFHKSPMCLFGIHGHAVRGWQSGAMMETGHKFKSPTNLNYRNRHECHLCSTFDDCDFIGVLVSVLQRAAHDHDHHHIIRKMQSPWKQMGSSDTTTLKEHGELINYKTVTQTHRWCSTELAGPALFFTAHAPVGEMTFKQSVYCHIKKEGKAPLEARERL